MSLALSLWGVGVRVDGDPETVARLRRDFRRFEGDRDPVGIHLVANRSDPPEVRPHRRALRHLDGISWDEGDVRWVRWPGATVRHDFQQDAGEAWAGDADLLHEVLYLQLLSRVGEHHDRRGLHRVHALGLEVDGKAIIVVLPSGTGKSTLAFGALEAGFARLMADDMVLWDGARVYGFPSRLGAVRPPAGVDPRFVAPFPRWRHGMKYVVDVDAFGDRITAGPVAPGKLLVGHRGPGPGRPPRPVPSLLAGPELLRSMVIGVGLPQVIELTLRARDVGRLGWTAARRTRAAVTLARQSEVYHWRLGDDRAANLAALEALCRGR